MFVRSHKFHPRRALHRYEHMNRHPWRTVLSRVLQTYLRIRNVHPLTAFVTLQTITFTRLTAYWARISSRSSCHTLLTLCRILGGSTFSGALQLINWSGYLVYVFTCSQWLAHLYWCYDHRNRNHVFNWKSNRIEIVIFVHPVKRFFHWSIGSLIDAVASTGRPRTCSAVASN